MNTEKNGSLIEDEDLKQICYLGLVKAARTYKEDEHTLFSTYAYVVMKNEINMELRKIKKKSKDISIETYTTEDEKLTIGDLIPSETDIEELVIYNDYSQIDKYLEWLNDKEKEIVLLYIKGKSQTYISQKIGITQGHVSRIKSNAIQKIKRRLKI